MSIVVICESGQTFVESDENLINIDFMVHMNLYKQIKQNIDTIQESCDRLIRYHVRRLRLQFSISEEFEEDLVHNVYQSVCEKVWRGKYNVNVGKIPPCSGIKNICEWVVKDYCQKENAQKRRILNEADSYTTVGDEGIETRRSDENGNSIRKSVPSSGPKIPKEIIQKRKIKKLENYAKSEWAASTEERKAILMFLKKKTKQTEIAQKLYRSDSWVTTTKKKFIIAAYKKYPELIESYL